MNELDKHDLIPDIDDEFGSAVKIRIVGHMFSQDFARVPAKKKMSLFERFVSIFKSQDNMSIGVKVELDAEVIAVDEYWSNGLLCGKNPFKIGTILKLVSNNQRNVWMIEGEDLPWFVLDMNKGTFEHIV